MEERPCAFTGRKATAKLRFPEGDQHSWVEVPCSKEYAALRMHPKLQRYERELASYFWQTELDKAGIFSLEWDLDHQRAASYINSNDLFVQYESAKLQAEHEAQVEQGLEEHLKERLRGMK